MSKLWRRLHHSEGDSHLHEVDLDSFTVTSPTVIYMSGFMTTNRQPGFICGALKRLEEILDQRAASDRRPVETYAWSHSSLTNVFNVVAYNTFPETRAGRASLRFARKVILPLIATDIQDAPCGKQVASCTLRPQEEARKTLRNLPFLAYSSGSVTIQEVFNATYRLLHQTGVTDEAARDLLSEIVVVSVGSVSRVTREAERFTTLYLIASNDLAVRLKNLLWAPLRRFLTKRLYGQPHMLTARRVGKAALLLSARIRHSGWEWRRRKNGESWRSRIRPILPAWTLVSSHHELPYYITHDDKLSPFANIALYGLTNAIGRDRKKQVEELVAAPAGQPEAEVAAYRQKIAEALRRSRTLSL